MNLNTSFVTLNEVNHTQCVRVTHSDNNQKCDGARVHTLEVSVENTTDTVNYVQIQQHYSVVVVIDQNNEDCNNCEDVRLPWALFGTAMFIYNAIMLLAILACFRHFCYKHEANKHPGLWL